MRLSRMAHLSVFYHLVHHTSLPVQNVQFVSQDYQTYTSPFTNITPTRPYAVRVNGELIDPSNYVIYIRDGKIVFNNPLQASDIVTADFYYNPVPWMDGWPQVGEDAQDNMFNTPLAILVDGADIIENLALGGGTGHRFGVYCHIFSTNKGIVYDLSDMVVDALVDYDARLVDWRVAVPELADGRINPVFNYNDNVVGYITFERVQKENEPMEERRPDIFRCIVSAVARFERVSI